jgi:bifunctional non-homologous end joining protein LigD
MEWSTLRPMLASIAEVALDDPQFVYEPKYDGIRVLIAVEAGTGTVRIASRLGNDKTRQFPDLVRAFKTFGRKVKASVILDGEIVSLDEAGQPVGFQQLQGRIHLTGVTEHTVAALNIPVAFIAFDILQDGTQAVTQLPLTARRARLERVFENTGNERLRLSDVVPNDGRALYQWAQAAGWEGLIAKRADSLYQVGRRSLDWRKIKFVRRQEFVIGGWTEPRQSRSHFGALLLGVYEHKQLQYVGHTGTGFSEQELARVARLLQRLATSTCPFAVRPKPNEPPHWVRPRLIADVKFTEWTTDGKLRHPTYLGLRDDIDPLTVRREPVGRAPASTSRATPPKRQRTHAPGRLTSSSPPARSPGPELKLPRTLQLLVQVLEELEQGPGSGAVPLPGGLTLEVSHLKKVFWPKVGITKGELLRYYVQLSPWLLPVLTDRPLVMKRFPNGVTGKAFYQQRAPDAVPAGVRVEPLAEDEEVPARLIGGDLITLLYMTQLAVISQDPWFSRIGATLVVDYVALDLDPMPGVPFDQVARVALECRDVLQELHIPHGLKTSGASGLHLYIPMPLNITYDTGRLFCEMVATLVAHRIPKLATVTRFVDHRGRTVYIDYLQNLHGKTLASVYSARASDFAGVSTPITWEELEQGARPQDFTLRTVLRRFAETGDRWARFRRLPGVDLHSILEMLQRTSHTH